MARRVFLFGRRETMRGARVGGRAEGWEGGARGKGGRSRRGVFVVADLALGCLEISTGLLRCWDDGQ